MLMQFRKQQQPFVTGRSRKFFRAKKPKQMTVTGMLNDITQLISANYEKNLKSAVLKLVYKKSRPNMNRNW